MAALKSAAGSGLGVLLTTSVGAVGGRGPAGGGTMWPSRGPGISCAGGDSSRRGIGGREEMSLLSVGEPTAEPDIYILLFFFLNPIVQRRSRYLRIMFG
jgi:hypothetical protein